MKRNYFQGTATSPFHLSVGVVLINEKNEVACHYFKNSPEKAPGEYRGLEDMYLLMRETPEFGESIEEAVRRGLMEEFGATGQIVTFLGSQEREFQGDTFSIIKTTVYFLVRLSEFDLTKRSHEDVEAESEIVFLAPDVCVAKMEEQWNRLKIETLNEAEIVLRAKQYLEQNSRE